MKTSTLFGHYLKEIAWEIMNFIFCCIQGIYWIINGTYWQLRESRLPANYKTSGQVLNVQFRHKLDTYIFQAKCSDFLLTHNRFENPEYVLQDHVCLYSVNENEAIFVEGPPGAELWRHKYSAVFLTAQYTFAQKVIILPIESFHRLASQVGDPAKVTFLCNTARCGSTLLTHMFEGTGQIVAISEPSSTNVLTKLTERKGSADRLVVSTIRMLCKPTQMKEVGHVIKLTAPAMFQIDKLVKMFPKSRCIFMYRDPLKVAQSLYRLSEELPMIKTVFFFGKGSARRFSMALGLMGLPADDFRRVGVTEYLSIGVALHCICQKTYNNLRDSGVEIAAVRYEDIIEDPTDSMRRILRYCNYPDDGLEGSVKAMEVDSQIGTLLSTTHLRKHPLLPYAGSAKDECDRVCDLFKIPHLDQEHIIPGTITYKGKANKEVTS